NAYRQEVSGGRGRPSSNIEATLNGIWWILCTGAMWNQLPQRFGKHDSISRCFRRWSSCGLWEWALKRLSSSKREYNVAIILDASYVKAHQDASKHPLSAAKQKLGKTKGGCNTKLSVAVNLIGRPLSIKLVPGNEHDSKSALDTLCGLVGGNFVLADKAYDTNNIRQRVREWGGFAVIPPKSNRKEKIEYDKEVGKIRHRVENFFCRIKRFRRIATRYEKLPETYLGFVTIAAISDWVKM
ncbi:IS5 family transposase, partial [Puniceicoccaceae bacterium K14]|nr:IS5 family transposase [Puniceicoccaceae bacterium K14]